MREVGELSGPAGLFSAIVFGFCAATNRFRAFRLAPVIEAGTLRVVTSEHDLYGSDTLLVIGNRPELLRERVKAERPNFYAGADSATPELVDLRETDLPRHALEALIREGADETVGGTIQAAWLTRAGFEPIARLTPIVPRPPSGSNFTLTVLGFDMFEFSTIGQYAFSLSGR
jgi:hypothetical protein